MLFTSYAFLGFLLVLIPAYYLVPKRGQQPLLLAASYLFYAAVYLLIGKSHIFRTESDVLIDGLLKYLIFGVLENKSYFKTDIAYFHVLAPDVLSVDINFARGRLYKTVEVLYKR